MKKFTKIFASLLCAVAFALPALTACDMFGGGKDSGGDKGGNEKPVVGTIGDENWVDYVSTLKLDPTDKTTKKQEVVMYLHIDGDTTHFKVKTNNPVTGSQTSDMDLTSTNGVIKARYLAVNTPESTGEIEKWGKTASLYVEDKLTKAESIVIESNDSQWNKDSNDRFLLFIWYKPAGGEDYINLNVELLQYGYGRGSSTASNIYGTTAMAALQQAQAYQLICFSPADTVDRNFFDGDAINITMKELRFRGDEFLNKSVRVEGTVTARFGNSVYFEDYDRETGITYGFAAFYGYKGGTLLEILTPGNRVSVWGKVTEFHGTYQLSDLKYRELNPDFEENTFLLPDDSMEYETFKEINAGDITSTKLVTAEFPIRDENGEETGEMKTLSIAMREAIMATSVSLTELYVYDSYTTSTGNSEGAMTLYCRDKNNVEVTVRTEVLKDANGNTITASAYLNKTIDVKGVVAKYESGDPRYGVSYQIAVHRPDYIFNIR